MVSAVAREAWTGTQELCFRTAKNKEGKYIETQTVFPSHRSDSHPELLPEDPKEIVELAVKKARQQPVLFWGKSSVYASCPGWPAD